MDVQLTDDQKAFVEQAIASGRIHAEEDAVRQAMALWEERERRRFELLAMLDEAEDSLARGEGITLSCEEDFAQLARDVEKKGRERLGMSSDDH